MKETQLSEAEGMKRSVAEELRRTREQLKTEREKWHQEREALKQVSMHHRISKIYVACYAPHALYNNNNVP